MSNAQTEKIACRVDGSSWYRSLESAYLRITSPSGKSIRISKLPNSSLTNKWDKDESVRELVWRVYSESIDGTGRTVMLTIDEMALLKKFSDNQNDRPPFKKEPVLMSHSLGIQGGNCGCGGRIKTKDHGSWVGWHCDSCGAGGSYNKKSSYGKR